MTTALPQTVVGYLAAHETRDADRALPHFTPDATVADDGRTYHGPAEIRGWLEGAASEHTYTSTLIATEQIDDDHVVATHHLEGDFPGGQVDLHFRFTLDHGLISRLVIEP
ncbi:nuclear transport factor 2 family protein [Amycolatopsis carbonis]|uniref:Nuclear transport factor 2 family protein n=1 Tax=Amycolatopsis carbonis TaxID=715471 RepID=A0A9Y2INH7_9PSEU|nr:nuclear transport factor 2 family protein [Amycolatopsis sp. 2-15]WIX83600.1 nuclear transport factor 2 family protein [Amycolatopsis sp. 2-15]